MNDSITSTLWGMKDGKEVQFFSITNSLSTTLQLSTYGASIVSCKFSNGLDAILGDKRFEHFTNGLHPHFGTTTGRLAGRSSTKPFVWPRKDIAQGVTPAEYQLKGNERPETHLHGGEAAFGRRVWDSGTPFETDHMIGIDFSLHSPHLEAGYPGDIHVISRIGLYKNSNSIHTSYEVTSDTIAPINLTNHAYFNLGTQDILEDTLTIDSDKICEYTEYAQVTGAFIDVQDTPFDFRKGAKIASVLDAIKQNDISARAGIDHVFVLNNRIQNQPLAKDMKHIASYQASNGNSIKVMSTATALVCYGGNYLYKYTNGDRPYRAYESICLEAQHIPGFLHNMQTPASYVTPSTAWKEFTEYHFTIL